MFSVGVRLQKTANLIISVMIGFAKKAITNQVKNTT